MAKKSAKRQYRPQAQHRQSSTAQPSRAAAQTPPALPSSADLANEYRYVLGDLRRVGILAASMLVLLIAIALVAQFVIK